MTAKIIGKNMISEATGRNWQRLQTNGNGRLMSRANKQLSTKTILPVEYFSNRKNIAEIQWFVERCMKQGYTAEDVVFSMGMRLLNDAGISEKSHVVQTLKSLEIPNLLDLTQLSPLPSDEFDVLGLLYQCFIAEGEKNRKGSYYTPRDVARNMTKNLDFSSGQTFFDPCCGSGAFMLSLQNVKPSQIFGCDNDPIAVTIAKINLLLKFPDEVFEPQIVCCDYLNSSDEFRYSYIISNPPWGAAVFDDENKPIASKESFSVFFEKAFRQLENQGVIRFLLPESVLNVKCHRKFRKFLIENGDLQSITRYPGTFSGVQTKYIDIETKKTKQALPDPYVIVYDSGSESVVHKVKKSVFHLTRNLNFNLLSDSDLEKLMKIVSKGRYTLKDSCWALGIVTGDNRKHLKHKQGRGLEPIYTGKEIDYFTLKRPRNYIKYERSVFQQVAKDEIYRANEKLVYKFISGNLVFAYDDSKSLFLNSANIIIPRIPGMSIKTVLAFLNSGVFKFLYKSLFGEIKILKGNLMELPFPEITPETDRKLTCLVDKVLKGNTQAIQEIDAEINKVIDG